MTGTGPVGFGDAPAQPAITIAATIATQARIPFRMIIGRRRGRRWFRATGRIASMPDTDPLVYGQSSDNDRVAECELAPEEAALLAGLTERARRAGAARLGARA